jgi:hypothetical protein
MVNKSLHGKQETEKPSKRMGVSIQLIRKGQGRDGDDADLVEAIEAIPLGKRQETLKNWLRESQGFKTALLSDTSGADHSEALSYLVDRMQWMEGQIAALHPYLEDKFAAFKGVPSFGFTPPAEPPSQEALSEEALKKRAERLNKRKWS